MVSPSLACDGGANGPFTWRMNRLKNCDIPVQIGGLKLRIIYSDDRARLLMGVGPPGPQGDHSRTERCDSGRIRFTSDQFACTLTPCCAGWKPLVVARLRPIAPD